MGFAKRQLEEIEARGYNDVDTFVCQNCFPSEEYLQQTIIENAIDNETCSYCNDNDSSAKVCSLSTILPVIVSGLQYEYDMPENCLPYETREGGWQGTTYDTYDLISDEVSLESDKLHSDIVNSIHQEVWCKHNPFSLSYDEMLKYGWDEFKTLVKHHSRFFFFYYKPKETYDFDEIPPSLILQKIGDEIENLNLLHTITDEKLYRIVWIKENEAMETSRLASPPNHLCHNSHRMSPRGISMFYASLDKKTAQCETQQKGSEDNVSICGIWQTKEPLLLIDLSDIEKMPSLFDEDNRHKRDAIMFLQGFIRDISQDIDNGNQNNIEIEYLPTQIIAEYFRYAFTINDNKIDGLIYPSAKNKEGKNVVLFMDNDICIEKLSLLEYDKLT